jgi:hypothetical protein
LAAFKPKYDKAAVCLAFDRAALLTHFDLPFRAWETLAHYPPEGVGIRQRAAAPAHLS